ncbi:MAG: hypothetical protein KAQ83_02015 [Nanoarchaeota archaeon]|nr:hypothetical protein [Nanoarchaeota archaeon]
MQYAYKKGKPFISKKEVVNEFLKENIELVVYSTICFFLPLFLGHPQFLVGTIVNTSLVLAALRLKTKQLLPVIIMPALGVLSRGLLFGPFTIYLLYMIPFIWIGNTLLVYFVRKINKKFVSLPVAAITKSAFLFSAAFVLVKLSIIPVIFLAAMGPVQLLTALSGGTLALIGNKLF